VEEGQIAPIFATGIGHPCSASLKRSTMGGCMSIKSDSDEEDNKGRNARTSKKINQCNEAYIQCPEWRYKPSNPKSCGGIDQRGMDGLGEKKSTTRAPYTAPNCTPNAGNLMPITCFRLAELQLDVSSTHTCFINRYGAFI